MTLQADETLRPEFEAWLNPGAHEGNVSAWVAPGRYEKEAHQLAWLAWQAARTKALPEQFVEAGRFINYDDDQWVKVDATYVNDPAVVTLYKRAT